MLTAKNLMTSAVTTNARATVADAAETMKRQKTGALVVTAGDRPVGVITDGDIALRSTAEGFEPTNVPVDAVTSAEVTGCFDDTSAEEGMSIMKERNLQRLPVFDREHHRLIGMLSVNELPQSS